MPRHLAKVPAYCLHKPSGRAVVNIRRKSYYLGPYGSEESHVAYEELIVRWRQDQSRQRVVATKGSRRSRRPLDSDWRCLSVNELLLRYFQFAATYYVDGLGNKTHEYDNMRYAARALREVYGRTLVRDFGPRDLKELRTQLVDSGQLCRQVINRRINRIRRIFKWAVSEELAPSGAYEALRAVEPLKAGRTVAREALPVKPVPQSHVDAVLAVVSPQIATMIRLQQLAGMRPQDIVGMRACDIDCAKDVWIYTPTQHKNLWRGHVRKIFLGPKSQSLLEPYLQDRTPDAFLFSPVEAERARNEHRRRARKSPLTPSQRRRRPKLNPKRRKGDRYSESSYRHAIRYGIAKANRARVESGLDEIPHWFPLQIRHSRATEIRRLYGLEAAQLTLGQKHARVTEVYAERDEERAMQIAREAG